MDEFFEYWETLPGCTRYENIGQEIVRYKRNLQDTEVTSTDLSQNVVNFLQEKLLEYPYPTNNIINHIIDPKDPDKNQILEEIIINTLVKLLDLIAENPDEINNKARLYNLLSNVFISDNKLHKIQSVIIPALYDLKENKKSLDHALYFALLSRSSPSILKQYLEYEHSRIIEKFDERTMFLKCYIQKKHWIQSLFNSDAAQDTFNQDFYENFRLCSTVLNPPNNSETLPALPNDSSVIENNFLHLYFLELSRQSAITKFIKDHQHSGTVDTTKSHLMTQLLRLMIPFNMDKYDKILELIKYNYENNLQQMSKYHRQNYRNYGMRTEMQVLNEYMIVKLYLQKIIQKNSANESNEIYINHIRSLLKTINDGSVLFNIMQMVLNMVFIKYEHIRKVRLRQKSKEDRSSSSSSNLNNFSNSTEISDSMLIDSYNNRGFVCSKGNLEMILNSLRLFLMSLDINEAYKNCDDDLKSKFKDLLKIVDVGIWKLQLIDANTQADYQNEEKSSQLWLTQHNNDNKSNLELTNPNEENVEQKKSRKKLKKRSRNSLETLEKSVSNEKYSDWMAMMAEYSQYSANRTLLDQEKRCENFIEKMLMGPESLIVLCARNNDEENIKKIIQDYKITDTNIVQEIEFIKFFQETLGKLKSIVCEYIEMQQRGNSTKITEIMNTAQAGFIVVRFSDVLDKFCSKPFNHLNSNDILLEKFVAKFPFLELYRQPIVQATMVADIMISQTDNYEMILLMSRFFEKTLSKSNQDYYSGFVRKLIEILKTNEMSVKDLLIDNICSLEPLSFKKQIKNRENLANVLQMDIKKLSDEPTLQDLLPQFEDFQSDIDYFKRIYSYVINVRYLVKFQSNEFLNVDEVIKHLNIYELIGKIVYDHQYNPELLEMCAYAANVNLLHGIAIAGGYELLPPLWKHKRAYGDEDSANSTTINARAPKTSDNQAPKIFNITNTNILYYVKTSGSFLVAYLIKELQDFNYQSLKYDDPNFFDRMKKLESIATLKRLYGDNLTLSVLNYDCVDLDMLGVKISNFDENEKLKILSCISERIVCQNKSKFNELKDSYIETLMNGEQTAVEKLLKSIGNARKFNQLLLKYIKSIKCDRQVETLLSWSLKDRHSDEWKELDEWMRKIQIYRQILVLFQKAKIQEYKNVTWLDILELAENKTSVLINFLINLSTDLDLCNQLLKFHPLQRKNEEVYKIFIEALNKEKFNDQHETLFKIIQNYSTKFLLDFFDYSLDYVRNMKSMRFILNYLLIHELTPENHIRYQKFEISCTIIGHLDASNGQLWSLAAYPLILIEQILMNSKIESLNVIVKELRKLLEACPSCNLCNTTTKQYQIDEILVYDFDAYHNGYRISNDCLDFLFKIYAAKALDFQIVDIPTQPSSSVHSGSAGHGSATNQVHQMPKEIPAKENWVPDNEAVFCMCCRKSKFSLLNRRHHCRRCGNVICGDCSRKRVSLPERYNELMVRCCDDCYSQMESKRRKVDHSDKSNRSADMQIEWKLTGNVETDQMIRDEFTFEYSPNVGRCIAIICLHTINEEFTNFLLFHCHRLELLLRPINGHLNPEVDVILVGLMLKYLAKTAKLFGDSDESNAIIDQIDIILKLAENDCDLILSKATYNVVTNNLSIRDIINELTKLENWKLALELSVKWDRNSTSGVFSAWTASLIKGGYYSLAREKMTLALQPVSGSSTKNNEELIDALRADGPIGDYKFLYKRLTKSSPLLCEILEIIDAVVPKVSCKKEGPTIPIDNLKRIMNGDYEGSGRKPSNISDWNPVELLKSPYYEESIHYLINYGGNVDILDFFLKNNLVKYAIRYALIQKISHDMFTQCIFIPMVKLGRIADFMILLKEIDVNFDKSKNYITALSKYLDRKKSLQVLYQVQLLIGDNIRAALTSIKFYLNQSGNYTELNEKSRHLVNAKNHLQQELERVESGIDENRHEIQLKWDIKKINAQINIILLQLEVSKYLANCEAQGYLTLGLMPKVFLDKISLKTLMGKPNEKSQVAILLLICGHSIESSFGLCYRIIQECSLQSSKIYSTCTKYLAHDLQRLIEVEKLINCIKTNASNGENTIDSDTEKLCDDLICMAVEIAYTQHSSQAKIQIDQLIKLISSKTKKIQCYINSNQLKTAFVHSAALNNLDYIKRIMKQAESTRQENIRRLCEKKLHQSMCSSLTGSDIMNESTSGSFHK